MKLTDKFEDVEPGGEIAFILWEEQDIEDQQATLNDMLADPDSPITT